MKKMLTLKFFSTSLILLVLMLGYTTIGLAQHIVSGVIMDETSNEPLPGVNVVIKGTTTGTVSDIDGKYSLSVPSEEVTLIFSSIGFISEEIIVGEQSVINLTMIPDITSLGELVVVGYGTANKATLSGSVATVGSEKFESLPISNPVAALQGTLPGMLIERSSGMAGNEGYSINVRGFSSINGTANALVIIDGVPGDLSQLNPNDIKSATVLKDGAAAIYGARAAGGVLLVTTKEGNTGKPSVHVNMSYSHKKPTGGFDQLNSAQVVEMDMEAHANAGSTSDWNEQNLADMRAGNVHPVDLGWSTLFTGSWDWTDLVIGTGSQQNYDINISGSGEYGRYRTSVGYIEDQGVFRYGDDKNRKLNANLNYSYDISDKLKVDTRVGFSKQLRKEPSMNPMHLVNTMYPFQRPTVWEDETKWANAYDNPIQWLIEGGTAEFNNTNLNANAKIDYEIIEGLTFTGQVGARYRFDHDTRFYRKMEKYHPLDGRVIGTTSDPNAGEMWQHNHTYSTVIGYLNYVKSFNNLHDISITAGASQEQNKYRFFTARRTGYPSNEFFSLNLGDGESQTNNSGGEDWAINSLFGRASYMYSSKYIIEGNFRYDGSSRFAPETRWGFFWGASAAWRLSEEDFMKDLGIFDELKLRVSYGETGNQDGIGLYDYVQRIKIEGAYPFGDGAKIANAALGAFVDRNRTWETIQTQNIGLDFGVLVNRLSGSFDYFIKHNKDMLIPVTLPSVLGAAPPAGNNGELKAWGWEAVLNWNDKINKDWSYSLGFNLSDSENKVINYGGQDTYHHGLVWVREGYAINTYHGMIADGIIKTQEELDAYKAIPGAPGDIGIGDAKYKDVNGDGKISTYADDGTQGDVVPLGSTTPRYFYGANIGLRFKGFEFSALIQGVGKRELQMDGDWQMPWAQPWHKPDARWYHNTWSPERPDNPNPRQTHGGIRWWNYHYSDRTAIDASYIRLKNVSIAYNLPESLLSRIGIQNAKIYAVGYDLWEKQHLGGGFDVETLKVGQTVPNVYPFLRTYTIGLNLTF